MQGQAKRPATAPELSAAPAEVKRYQYHKRLALFGNLAVRAAALTVAAFLVGPWLGESLRELNPRFESSRGPWLLALAAVYLAALNLLALPLDYWSEYVLEHRHGLSNQNLREWFRSWVRHAFFGGAIGLVLILGLYLIIWNVGPWWWLAAAGAYLFFIVVMGRLVPVLILPLFYRFTKLDDETLVARVKRLLEGTGFSVEGVYRWHLGEETKKANAALAGLGRRRRIILSDTLLENFTPEEIEVVLAHELGHHAHGHLAKSLAVSFVFALAGFGLLALFGEPLARFAGYEGLPALAQPAALPMLLFLFTMMGMLLQPARLALSRHFERQADRHAVRLTGDRAAFRSAFVKLARLNKIDPDPHPLVVWLLSSHPPVRERLAACEAAGV